MTDAETMRVNVFRLPDGTPVHGTDLRSLLCPGFEAILGESLAEARFRLTFHSTPQPEEAFADTALLVNMRPSVGLITVQITKRDRVIYRRPHSVRQLVAEALRRELARDTTDIGRLGFEITATTASRRCGPSGWRTFAMERLPGPVLSPVKFADLGVSDRPPVSANGVVVVLSDSAAATLDTCDAEVEEGGLLLGEVLEAGSRQHLVHVRQAVPVDDTRASATSFTFAAESFLDVDHSDPGRSLIGWYHTHLDSAADLIPSDTDRQMHAMVFRQPWQIAVIVGTRLPEREACVFGRAGDRLVRLPLYRTDGGWR